MEQIAAWVDEAIDGAEDEQRLEAIAAQVADFCKTFPPPGLPYE